jgi:hypothetical protein
MLRNARIIGHVQLTSPAEASWQRWLFPADMTFEALRRARNELAHVLSVACSVVDRKQSTWDDATKLRFSDLYAPMILHPRHLSCVVHEWIIEQNIVYIFSVDVGCRVHLIRKWLVRIGGPLAAHMYTCHGSARSTCITRYGLLWKVYGWTNEMLGSGYLRCSLKFRSACVYGPRGLCAMYHSQRCSVRLGPPASALLFLLQLLLLPLPFHQHR